MMGDVAKLPRWARIEIERLTADLAFTKRELANALGKEPTAIEIDPYRNLGGGNSPRCFVPDNTVIRYAVHGGEIDISLRHGAVNVSGNQRGLAEFVIVPRAGNLVEARLVERKP